MTIEPLKEQARRHEQREEWQKALDLYREAIRNHPEDLPPDITLFNRVGDLQTRLGQFDGAVEHYDRAISLYVEAELPNNAIAICKKVLRNLPDRHAFFLTMGKIRAGQGFLTDARQNFLTYAERMTALGNTEGALDALVEFVDLAPEDVEIRLGLASQLESHDRNAEALDQYQEAYRRLVVQEREEEAADLAQKLQGIAPELELPGPEAILEAESAAADDGLGGFESTSLADIELGTGAEEPSELKVPEEEEEEYEPSQYGEVDLVEKGEGAAEEEAEVATAEEDWVDPDTGWESPEEDAMEELPLLGADDDEEDIVASDEGDILALEKELVETLPGLESGDYGNEEPDSLPLLDEAEEIDEAREEALEEALGDTDLLTVEEAAPGEGESSDEAVLWAEDEAEADTEAAQALWVDEEEDEGLDLQQAEVAAAQEEMSLDVLADEETEPGVPGDHIEAAEQGDLALAVAMVQTAILSDPDQVDHRQRLVEYAFRKSDEPLLVSAYLGLAGCLARTGQSVKSSAVFQQVLSLDPGNEEARDGLRELGQETAPAEPAEVASSEEYVDLGSLILGEEAEKTTRWTVAADAPSGDEEADFAKMLGQFKEKVSEHLAVDDVAAHYDLGTAYMEMGLLDEAIGEFQMALRASPGHLPTHEVMGRCWIKKEQPEMAVRGLRRALDGDFGVEDELIGIYYLMGQAQETLGNTEDALEFYEKVFSLDINFEDVTERLRALR